MKNRKCFHCGYWNPGNALYCGLCYVPFNRAVRPARSPAAPPPAKPPVRIKPLAAAIVLALPVCAACLWLLRPVPRQTSLQEAGTVVSPLKEKMEKADRLLDGYIREKEALLEEINAGPADPEGFGMDGQYTAKLFAVEETYDAACRGLELPRPESMDKNGDALYLNWLQKHRSRESAAMLNFSDRYQETARKAVTPAP